MTDEELIALAARARRDAYAPYSRFAVGAAVVTASGRVFTGANVENASYGLSVCAERVAAWKAVSEGESEIVAVAVVTGDGVTPCGACRQVLAEFAPRERGLAGMRVLVADAHGRHTAHTLDELLPAAFTPEDLRT
jgi:cytidine deaminase